MKKKDNKNEQSNKRLYIVLIIFVSILSFILGTLFGKGLFESNNTESKNIVENN